MPIDDTLLNPATPNGYTPAASTGSAPHTQHYPGQFMDNATTMAMFGALGSYGGFAQCTSQFNGHNGMPTTAPSHGGPATAGQPLQPAPAATMAHGNSTAHISPANDKENYSTQRKRQRSASADFDAFRASIRPPPGLSTSSGPSMPSAAGSGGNISKPSWTPLPMAFVVGLVEEHTLDAVAEKRLVARYRWLNELGYQHAESKLDLSAAAAALEQLQLTYKILECYQALKDNVGTISENVKVNYTPSNASITYANKLGKDLLVKPDRLQFSDLKRDIYDVLEANLVAAFLPPMAVQGAARDKTMKMCANAANNARSTMSKDASLSIDQGQKLRDFCYDTAKDYVLEGVKLPMDPNFVGHLALLRAYVRERSAETTASVSGISASSSSTSGATPPSTTSEKPKSTRGRANVESAATTTFWAAYEHWLMEKREKNRSATAWQLFIDRVVAEDNALYDPPAAPATGNALASASQFSAPYAFDEDTSIYSS
ncbi:hypothetical protein EV122DRAFT_282212 [Schizophyllum commune]